MKKNDLTGFIEHARSKDMDHSTIRMLLLSAGWKEKEIAQALSKQGLDVEVPIPPDVGGAREAFLHLLSFVGLYTLVVSLSILLFQYIHRALPDAANPVYSSTADYSGIRMSMAAIIVAFPLLLWMSRLIQKEILSHPQKAWSPIRRWLTYITLFAAATALMIDGITLIFHLLEGELSIRFFLKVLVVFLLATTTFLYYLLSLKSTPNSMKRLNRLFGLIASVVVCSSFVWGIVLVGSPFSGRMQRFDELRLNHLQTLTNEIFAIVYNDRSPKGPTINPSPVAPLPESLQDIANQALYSRPVLQDPETGEFYMYTVLDTYSFEVCATFSFERDENYALAWNHPSGEHCFTFDTRERNTY